MGQQDVVVVERIRDKGQWFEPGLRVELASRRSGRGESQVERAALGAYEVLNCQQEVAAGGHWIVITLRRLLQR
jgi:hypothetical protein